MGIYGLSSFIQNNATLGEHQAWYSENAEANKDHLIFDGNAFAYYYGYLHRQHWTHGGQYESLARVIRQTVFVLKEAGFTLTFLFDGALPLEKQETRIKRYKEYIERSALTMNNLSAINSANKTNGSLFLLDGPQYSNDLYVIPPLTLEVCMQTLRELDVVVWICSEEADDVVARLAEETQGYVVSKDSDMHIYPNSGKGYIPLDSIAIPSSRQGRFVISATVYRSHALAKMLDLQLNLLPLFGTLLGNDYLDIQYIKYPIMTWLSTCTQVNIKQQGLTHWPRHVSRFIRQMEQLSPDASALVTTIVSQLKPIILRSGMSRKQHTVDTLEEVIMKSVRRYDQQCIFLSSNVEKVPGNVNSYIAPRQYSRQLLDLPLTQTMWTGIFLEDMQQESSWCLSRSLRQAIYGLMNMEHAKECIREKQHLANDIVNALSKNAYINSSDTGSSSGNSGNNRQFFLHLHHITSAALITVLDAKIPQPLQPLVICLHYFIYESAKSGKPLANHEVVAILVASMVDLVPTVLPSDFGVADAPTELNALLSSSASFNHHEKAKIPSLKKRSIQLSSQWQHILLSSHYLAQLLLSNDRSRHFQQEGVLSSLYNGLVMHTCLQMGRLGASMGRMMLGASPKWMHLFGMLYNLITSADGDVEVPIEKVFDYKFTSANSLTDMEQQTPPWVKSRILKKIDNVSQDRRMINKPTSHRKSAKTIHIPELIPNGNGFDVLSFGCQFDD